jgi:predicted RNA-binding protein with PIN domain
MSAVDEPVALPPAVRERVVRLASDRLGRLEADEVPAALRPFVRFAPARRARLAAVPLAVVLEADNAFRGSVAAELREGLPDLAAALDAGAALPAAPPEDVAAAAYLLRPPGWQEHVRRAADELTRETPAPDADAVQRLTEQLAALRTAARTEAERLRGEVEAERAEAVALRRRLREMGDRAGRAEKAALAAREQLAGDRQVLAADRAELAAETRRLADRVAEAEQAVRSVRSAAREGRQADELRLRVLLDALLGAASGLRRELALAPAEGRPADALAGDYPAPAPGGPARQGRSDDDPALLDALLGVPMTHLLVDGYNVTKTGYGDLALEAQRGRLLSGLGALAARTGAEVTVVFDGTGPGPVLAAPAPRGVRLLFSRDGETADEVLRRLARHEPPGRPVVVVSTDREVADGVRSAGARAVPSLALVRLLDHSRSRPVGPPP